MISSINVVSDFTNVPRDCTDNSLSVYPCFCPDSVPVPGPIPEPTPNPWAWFTPDPGPNSKADSVVDPVTLLMGSIKAPTGVIIVEGFEPCTSPWSWPVPCPIAVKDTGTGTGPCLAPRPGKRWRSWWFGIRCDGNIIRYDGNMIKWLEMCVKVCWNMLKYY